MSRAWAAALAALMLLQGCGAPPKRGRLDLDSAPAYSIGVEAGGMRQPADEASALARDGGRLFLK